MLKTEAVVLSLRKHKEHDFLVSFFTKDFGKVVILARGANKLNSKLSPFLHYPGVVRCGFVEGRHMPVLTDVDGIFMPISFAGREQCELVTRVLLTLFEFCGAALYERQEDKRLWTFFLAVLKDFENYASKNLRQDECAVLYTKWLHKLLAVLGYVPPVVFDGAQGRNIPKAYSYDMLGEAYRRHFHLVPPALFEQP